MVELVIAMAILVLVGSLIGTASMIFYNAYSRTTRQTEKLKEFVAIDQVMDQCLRNAIPFRWQDKEEQKDKYVFLGKILGCQRKYSLFCQFDFTIFGYCERSSQVCFG